MKSLTYFGIQFLLIYVCLSIITSSCKVKEEVEVSILIKDVWILDGMGKEPFKGDIWILDETIAGIGKSPSNLKAKLIIDADGKVVSPGFIDLHAHGNPFSESGDFENFLYQGVTTICLGMDGFSPEDLNQWLINASDSSLSTNIAMFTGHSSIRMESGIDYQIDPSEQQMKGMASILDTALSLGSFGLSTGLNTGQVDWLRKSS